MSSPYVGEVRAVGFNFAPVGWLLCQGQIIPIAGYETLYNLIGTTYGGDGIQSFGLPNLQSRIPIHQGSLTGGSIYTIGQAGGQETVTVNANQYPQHTHTFSASSVSTGPVATPSNNTVGASSKIYADTTATPTTPMNPNMVSTAPGGSQPHNNLQPYLALNWIISLYGVFPSPR
ncbi:MAG: tail fiber protein [Terracidiphilus sp.]|jgi:microcystin-dependent protein